MRVIDVIYICYMKFMVMIVMKKVDEIKEVIYGKMVCGIIIVLVKGVFMNE